MFLKRYIPLFIVIGVGWFTLMGHFINNESIQNFVNNDATQWFDIIASFAILLGALNMLKLQLLKIIKKQKNWQYSILAVLGFAFAIFAGFFFRGANYLSISDIPKENIAKVSEVIWDKTQKSTPSTIEGKIISALENKGYSVDTVYSDRVSAQKLKDSIEKFINQCVIKEHADSGYYVVIKDLPEANISQVASMIWAETQESTPFIIGEKIRKGLEGYTIDKVFMTVGRAEEFITPIKPFITEYTTNAYPWGAHLQTKGSLFSWMYFQIYAPLSATMFALLAFFVASASYRAFRIRNFEATLLLVAGIILMLGRVPIGDLIPWWVVAILIVFGIGAISAPWIKDKKILFGLISGGIIIFLIAGFTLGWNQEPPQILLITVIQDWIFDYPTTAGSRALMIGIALGVVGTSFRIILGMERSFLGE